MTPKNGGKIELRLGGATSASPTAPASAEYEAHLQTATASFHTRVEVGANAGAKQVQFGVWTSEVSGEPPEWLMADARAALKAALRTSQAEGRWPRRITRWRPEPSD
jgi:hypothetical protein